MLAYGLRIHSAASIPVVRHYASDNCSHIHEACLAAMGTLMIPLAPHSNKIQPCSGVTAMHVKMAQARALDLSGVSAALLVQQTENEK